MKVLHVIPSFAPAWRYGGPVAAAVGITRALAREGHQVTVMTTNIDGPGLLDVPLERPVNMDGVDVWYFPVQRPRWYCFSTPLASSLRKRVDEFDVVHIHSIFLWPTTIAAFWCRKRRIPYIVHLFGSLDTLVERPAYHGAWAGLSGRLKKRLYMGTIGRWDLDRASGIQYTSRADMDAHAGFHLRARGHVIPLGIDTPTEPGRRPELEDQLPRLAGKKVVLFLSRLAHNKGLDILVSALGLLAARRDDFALVVAGSGPPAYEAKIESLVRNQGLQDRTFFLGFVQGEEKLRALRGADIFALPSHHENFPVAVMEAMAAGLPVVISDRVRNHRDISDAGAGLVTGLDPSEVAAAVESLLADRDRRHEMGDAGRRLTGLDYTWERVARMTLETYRSLLAGNGEAASAA